MNIGLVLSGGMAKGAYQIGALKALNNFIPPQEITYMSCASVGVLNGYAYATNGLERAETMWKNVCCNDTRMFINQVLRSSMLQQCIKDIYVQGEPLHTNFYCSILDANHMNIVYKNLASVDEKSIWPYLKASVAMPVYNRAIQIDGVSYYDGAMVDNIPVFPLTKHELDYIICIYFDDICYKFENTNFDNKVIKVTFPCDGMLKQSLVFKQDSIESMIQDGYDKTMHILKSVFYEGYDNLDSIYRTIHHMNKNSNNKKIRITGDVLVTNLNKITQKLTRKKILQ